MNKLLKVTLITAIMATSGMACGGYDQTYGQPYYHVPPMPCGACAPYLGPQTTDNQNIYMPTVRNWLVLGAIGLTMYKCFCGHEKHLIDITGSQVGEHHDAANEGLSILMTTNSQMLLTLSNKEMADFPAESSRAVNLYFARKDCCGNYVPECCSYAGVVCTGEQTEQGIDHRHFHFEERLRTFKDDPLARIKKAIIGCKLKNSDSKCFIERR